MKNDNSWRFKSLGIALAVLAILVILQIIRIQLSPEAKVIRDWGKYYARNWHVFYPARGKIYDRWGNIMAGNERSYEVAVDLTLVRDPRSIALAMSAVMADNPAYNREKYYDEVFAIASRSPITPPTYVVVANSVTEVELGRLIEMAVGNKKVSSSKGGKSSEASVLSGLVYRPRLKRVYIENTLASTVLGYVNLDGEGVYGIEEYFNEMLAGQPEVVWINVDPNEADHIPDAKDGNSLILTLDRQLQAKVEQILFKAINNSGSEAGAIVVMDPENGEILALATSIGIDPNKYWLYNTVLQGGIPFNKAVSQPYEPGSVFKVVTMAAALDAGVVTLDTHFLDTGSITIGGVTIHNWDYGAWGDQDMQGCMQHSLNVCLAWVATQLGAERFYAYMHRFGFGRMTGIDLAGEMAGRLKRPGDSDWFDGDLGTNAFGQGLSATIVQMLMAISAVANEGQMVSPHLVRAIIKDNQQFTPPYTVVDRPISAETAKIITEMLSRSLEAEASDALVPGYRVAGKTGTAEIPTLAGYTSSVTNASFVGWGPTEDPKFLVYIWLEKPTSSPWGSVVAAPVFSEVVLEVVRFLGIPPDSVRLTLNSH